MTILASIIEDVMSLSYQCARIRLMIRMLNDADQEELATWLRNEKRRGMTEYTGLNADCAKILRLGQTLKGLSETDLRNHVEPSAQNLSK